MSDIYDNESEFESYSILAKLLSEENIDVHWNVPMENAARMNMKTRVLEVAPIKEEHKHHIPGLILHEVGHHLFSPNIKTPKEEQRFSNAIKNQNIWNMVEDGYIERMLVKKWPSSSFYLKILYDYDAEKFEVSNNIFVDSINVFYLNVIGLKWGHSIPYDDALPRSLVELFYKGHFTVGDAIERAELSSQIYDELIKILPKKDREKIDRFDVDDFDPISELMEHGDSNLIIIGSDFEHNKIIDKSMKNRPVFFVPTFKDQQSVTIQNDFVPDSLWEKLKKYPFSSFIYDINDLLKSGQQKQALTLFGDKSEKSHAVARLLYQQFSVKANARNIAKTRNKTSGILDPSRASLYKIYDDIFEKRQYSPDQINHAYVVMIDWSSSMSMTAMELFHRVSELTYFGHLAKVEIEIWLYTSPGGGMHPAAARDNTAYSFSNFIKVINTKDASFDKIKHTLFAFYLSCGQAVGASEFVGIKTIIQGSLVGDYKSSTQHHMCGTNIFEALCFSYNRVKELDADKRSIILMSDGQDATVFERVKRCQYNISVNSVMQMGQIILDTNKYNNKNPDKQVDTVRNLASVYVCKEIQKSGISLLGISWLVPGIKTGLPIIMPKDHIIEISMRIKNPRFTEYINLQNQFITSIISALLSEM